MRMGRAVQRDGDRMIGGARGRHRTQRVVQDSSDASHDRSGVRSTRMNVRRVVDNSESSRMEDIEESKGTKGGAG